MLSIAKLSAGRAEYYLEHVHAGADEYYTADQAEPGQWAGKAAQLLGLRGQVSPEAFRRVLDARHPGSGEPLGVPVTSAKRVAGFDLCFSAPKSVSVAWALAPRQLAGAIAGAHDNAASQAVGAMEAEALRARRGAGGREVVPTVGLVGAAFPHRSSRAGDPQLHTHVVAANITPDDEGRWSAPYGHRIYAWAKTIGYLYHAELRAGLADLGFAFGPVRKGAAEIEGIPKAVLEAFSSRRAAIEAVLDERGLSSPEAAHAATLATRGPKASVPGLSQLRRTWHQRAAELGTGPELVAELASHGPEPAPDARGLHARLLGEDGLTANSSSFDRRAVLQALAEAHPGGARVAALRASADALTRSPAVVALATPAHAEPRYSTAELLALEAGILERAERQRGAGVGIAPGEVLGRVLESRPSLSAEQRRMVSVLTGSGDGAQVVVGRAGAGKTFALDAARAAWEASGHPVVGVALAARAAVELQAGAGIPSSTVDRLLADLERPGPLSGLAPGTVVVVDEAGMLGTRKLARLLDHAEAWGAAVVLVGDPRQLPEVAAGGAFSALARALPVSELKDNRRQAEAWERLALSELRSGSVAEALSAYERSGRLRLAPSADASREAMVDAWWASRRAGEDAMMYALHRADVDDLNARARARLEAAGELGSERAEAAGREFAVGDRVMCLRNDYRLGVRNGMVGSVASVDQGDVLLAEGTHLPASYLEAGHLTHAYASTVHKAQGATVDRAYLLGSDQLYREAGYVGMSRGRLSNELFVVGSDLADGFEDVAESLRTSRAQSLALDQVATRRGRQALLADPSLWATEALGEPPLIGPARQRWAERAGELACYRDAHGVTDQRSALGPEPEREPRRRDWELAHLVFLGPEQSQDLENGLTR
jgi:conjugative relaxase-like TrwC/TraI family protein